MAIRRMTSAVSEVLPVETGAASSAGRLALRL